MHAHDSGSSSAPSQAGSQRVVAWLAWAAMLLTSRLPQIAAQELYGVELPYGWWMLASAALLVGATYVWPRARPLRGYVAVLAALAAATSLLDAPVRGSAAWQRWFVDGGWATGFLGERLPLVVEAIGLAVALRLAGLRRADMFLVKGDVGAPPARLLALSTLGLATLFALGLAQLMPPQAGWWRVLPWLPAILLFALMNAFGEEMLYRAAPLSQLVPVVGPRHANWITAAWFGLGHYYGGFPSGPMGAAQATLVGLLFGRAMLASRGMVLPVALHMSIDVVIYLFLAMPAAAAGSP